MFDIWYFCLHFVHFSLGLFDNVCENSNSPLMQIRMKRQGSAHPEPMMNHTVRFILPFHRWFPLPRAVLEPVRRALSFGMSLQYANLPWSPPSYWYRSYAVGRRLALECYVRCYGGWHYQLPVQVTCRCTGTRLPTGRQAAPACAVLSTTDDTDDRRSWSVTPDTCVGYASNLSCNNSCPRS